MMKVICTYTAIGIFISIAGVGNAQASPKYNLVRSQSLSSKPSKQPSTSTLELSLNDIVKLVLQDNRDLKNNILDRVVQKQELKEAESKFNPTFTSSISFDVNHQFLSSNQFDDSSLDTGIENDSNVNNSGSIPSDSDSSASGTNNTGDMSTGSGNALQLGDRSQLNYGGQLSMNWLSPIGTRLSVATSPFTPQNIDVSITQPLLRGSGTRVNQASVKTARLGEQRNILTWQQTVIDKLTETVIAYRNLIKNQEAVRIQELALQSKRRQLEGTQALVDAGRKPQSELIQTQKSIADTEQSLVLARNTLAQANSDLLKLIESERDFTIVIPQVDIEAIRRSQLPSVNRSFSELLPMAYKTRADYQQAKLEIDSEKLGLLLVKDNQRWNLDFQSSTSLGESPQVSAGLILSQTFGEQSPKTERIRREIGVQKSQNKLAQLTQAVRQDVSDRIRDVDSALVQVSVSQRAKEFAQQQFDVAQTLFRRRGGQVTLFEIIQKQDDLIAAQNEEIQAKIEYLNAITNLEKAVGLTLDTWKEFLDLRLL
jgi:outer membrane protein